MHCRFLCLLAVLSVVLAVSPASSRAAEIVHASLDVPNAVGSTGAVVTKPGASPNMGVQHSRSGNGSYAVYVGDVPGDFTTSGVMLTSVAENGRSNGSGTQYPTSATVLDGDRILATVRQPATNAVVPFNVDTAVAWFPFEDFYGGVALNDLGSNGSAMETIVGHPDIDLGEEFADDGGGRFTLDLTALGARSEEGILLVNSAKAENNYALSQAHADGTFTIFSHDNRVHDAVYERDPVAFVYIPKNHGSEQIIAMGRIGGSQPISQGRFSVTVAADGIYHLAIPDHTHETGTLIISPEGGDSLNVDNIWSYEWHEANQHWVIQTRDLTGLGLQRLGNEAAFSFAFITTPPIHVDASAPDGGDGLTWATAYKDLNTAIAQMDRDDVLWVAEGTYTPTDTSTPFTFPDRVEIYGGFPPGGGDGTFEARNPNPATNNTILSGDLLGDDVADFGNRDDNAYRVVHLSSNYNGLRLDGFTIRGGNGTLFEGFLFDGSGIHCGNNTFGDLVNLIIEDNESGRGGGLFVDHGRTTFTNVIVRNNKASTDGGGIYVDSSSLSRFRFDNLLVSNNLAEGSGGGLYVMDDRVTIGNGTIADNHAALGGGAVAGNGNLVCSNSIVWGNTNTAGAPVEITLAVADHCTIQGEPGAFDPLFANADYDLAPGSPAIDAGENSLLPSDALDLDLDANVIEQIPSDVGSRLRIAGALVDLGARETCEDLSSTDHTVLTESWEIGLDRGTITDFLPSGWQTNAEPGTDQIWRPGSGAIGSRFYNADPLEAPAHGNNTLYVRNEGLVFKVTDTILEAGKSYTLKAAIGYDLEVDSRGWLLGLYTLQADGSGLDHSLGVTHESSPNAIIPTEGNWAVNEVRINGSDAPADALGRRLIVGLKHRAVGLGSTAYFDNVQLEVTGETDLDFTLPVAGAIDVDPNEAITMSFASDLNAATIHSGTVTVTGSLSGVLSGNIDVNGSQLIFTPSQALQEGETVTLTLSDSARSASGQSLGGAILRFQTRLPAAMALLSRDNVSRPESSAGNAVDALTGAFNPAFSPISVDGVRSLDFPLLYHSLFTGNQGQMGHGWSHAYEVRLTGNPHGTLTVLWDTTRRNAFKFAGPGVPYTPVDEAVQYAELIRRSDGVWWLTMEDGTVYEFGLNGRLERLGNKVFQWLEMRYESGRLASIFEPIAEKTLTVHYNDDGLVSGLSDDLGREVYFLYDNRQRLTTVTDPLYVGAAVIGDTFGPKNILGGDGLIHQMEFDGDGTVGRLRVEEGRFTNATNFEDLRITLMAPSGASTVIHDRTAHATEFDGLFIDGLDGEPARGTWTLQVQDLAGSATGQLVEWQMRFTGSTNSVHYTYADGAFPAAGQLIRADDVLGERFFANTYDPSGRVLTQDDGRDDNRLSTFTYESLPGGAQRTTYTDREGHPSVYDFNADRRLVLLSDPVGSGVAFEYNDRGDRTKAMDQMGNETAFEYDDDGNLITMIDAVGNRIPFVYDERRNVIAIHDIPRATEITYDERNNTTKVTHPSGRVLENTYDANSQLSAYVDYRLEESTNELIEAVTVGWAGTIGQRRTVTLPEGGEIVYLYDPLGRLVSTTNAEGKESTYTYSQTGKVTSETDPSGGVTFRCFDHRDRLVVIIDKESNRSTFEYDGNNNLIRRTNPEGQTTTIHYDGEDRSIARVDHLGNRQEQIRDAAGQLIEQVNEEGDRLYLQYDAAGRETRRYADDGTLILETSYDRLGLITTEYDANGEATTYSYNALREPTQLIVGNRRIGATLHNSDQKPLVGFGGQRVYTGNRISKLINNRDAVTEFRFDESLRVKRIQTEFSEASSSSLFTDYEYDDRSLVTKETYASGKVLNYAYDAVGRLESITPDGSRSFQPGKRFVYDDNGNAIEVRGETDTPLLREYDGLNRMTRAVDVDGRDIRIQYDGVGNVSLIVYPNGDTVSYAYDGAGRLELVTDWANRETRYHYNENGWIIQIDLPNGTQRRLTYDTRGDVLSQVDTDIHGQLIVGYDFRRDQPDKIATEVPRHEEPPYIPQAVSMSYDLADRLTHYNGQAVTFDLEGNMTNAPLGMGQMTYDAFNNLATVGGYSYHYDAEDHLIGWTVNGQETKFDVNPAFGSAQVLAKRTDISETRYVYGVGLLYEVTGGTAKFFHQDSRGSTVAISHSSGVAVGQIAYSPYGKIIHRAGDTDTLFLFNGAYGVLTSPQEFVYMRYRWYWPEIRRFINRDAHLGDIFEVDSMNRYAFAGNDPVARIDPNGELWFLAPAAGALAGATIGAGVTLVADFLDDGKINSPWQDYASAAIGGAVTGAILTVNPGAAFAAGGLGAAAENVSNALLKEESIDGKELVKDVLVGAAAGKAGKAGGKVFRKAKIKVFGKSSNAAKRRAVRGWGEIMKVSAREEAKRAAIGILKKSGGLIGRTLLQSLSESSRESGSEGGGGGGDGGLPSVKPGIERRAAFATQSALDRRFGAFIHWRFYVEALETAGRAAPTNPNNTLGNF